MIKRNYILAKRNRFLIVLFIIALLAATIGYIFGYHNGTEKARSEYPLFPNTRITAKPVIEAKAEAVETVAIEPLPASDAEIDLLALITMAEAESECELGKRLVIDTMLNRVDSDRFPNSIHDVIYAPGQFECTWNGRLERCYVKDDIRELVIDELKNRTRYDVHYFRAGRYHDFGIPVIQVGNHYFSTYKK